MKAVLVMCVIGIAWIFMSHSGSSFHSTGSVKGDLTAYYQQVVAAIAPCDNATSTVSNDAKAIAGGNGDLVTAYQEAQTAEQACEQASKSIPSVPDSLQGLGLDQGVTDFTNAVTDKQYAASDAVTIFNGNADTATLADFGTWADDGYKELLAGTARFYLTGKKVGVDLSKVQTAESNS